VHDGFRTCLMVFRIVAGVVAGVVTGGDEVYPHSLARVITGGVYTHLNARGTLLPSCQGKKPCLSFAGVAGVRQLGPCARVRLPPSGRQRTSLFHGVLRKTHAAARENGSSSSSWNLTLLAGVADNTEEDQQRSGCGASSLQNLPVESSAIPATEMRKAKGRRWGGQFIKKVRRCK
jgi:hypothetical protein